MARLPTFAENLVSYRNALGLQKADLARMVNVTPSTMTRYESGDQKPTGIILVALSEVLGVAPKALLGSDAKPLPKAKPSPRVGRPPKDAAAASMLAELGKASPAQGEEAKLLPPAATRARQAKGEPE